MADSKNFGMLKQTEKMKTGIRYLATLFRIALAFFMFWNWNARYVRFAIHHTLRRSPSYGNLWHKSKTKIFNFRWGLFYIKLQNSTKNYPSNPPFQHQQLCICALTQKFTPTFFFASSNTFQNGMTLPSTIKNHGAARFQAKGLGGDQGLTRRDWTGYQAPT